MAPVLPSETQALRTIERIVGDAMPPGWTLRAQTSRRRRGPRTGAAWDVCAPDGQVAAFAVEARRTVAGRELGEMLAQLNVVLGETGDTGARPLVAAAHLSQTLRAELADRGVSYADATGNVRLVADQPGLFVELQGAAKNPWPTDDALRSLRGRGAGRAVRALVDFRPPFGVRDLAQRASVPLGSVSRSLELLDREGLVERGERGEVVGLDWERAIRRWAQDYEFSRSNRVATYLDPRGLSAVTEKLSEEKGTYALTGATAAQRFAPIAPARQVALYVEDTKRFAERLRLRPADAGANVVLVEPFDPVVFERTITRDGLRVVAASQLSVDLLTGTGREPSEGIEFLAWMGANEEAWRA